MAQNRLFAILYLLLQNRRMTAQALAERLEVSVRTIYRDVDALSAAGIPVCTTPGQGGGVYLMDHFVLDRAAFSVKEQRQLLTALQSIPAGTGEEADQVREKLSGLFQRQEPDWLQVDLSRWGSGAAGHARFDLLRQAILSRRQVVFTYFSSSGQVSRRRLFPARLVFKGHAWYLQGFCLEKEDYRTFRLTRMAEIQVLEEPVNRLLAPPPIEGEGPPAPFCTELRLCFSPYLAYRVYDEFDESCITREADGSLLVAVTMPEDGWLYGHLLSYGLGVTVLSPARLRRQLGLLARKIYHSCGIADIRCQDSDGTLESSQTEEAYSTMEHTRQFCQSCGMPMEAARPGTERDGGPSPHYCIYCYQDGAFTKDWTMEEMIDFCAPHMAQGNPGMTEEQAKDQMRKFFPMLLRWKQGCAAGDLDSEDTRRTRTTAYRLTGVTIRTDNSDRGMAQIGALWDDVLQGTLPLLRDSGGQPVPDVIPVARYSGYDSGPAGGYDLTILAVTADFLRELEAEAAAGRYRTYEVRGTGDLKQCTQEAWVQAWGDQTTQRAFSTAYEVSTPAAYAPDGVDSCRLYIAVQQEN